MDSQFEEALKICEKLYQGGVGGPLYTIDKSDQSLVGKEFTYKGHQVVVMRADPNKKTIAVARLVRGKPDTRHGLTVLTKREFDRAIKHYEEQTEAKKKKKCNCINWPWEYDPDCPCHRHLIWFAPFFGKADGKSPAAISTAPSGETTGGGPAYPGAGGINMPGVPSGPNTGMGPTMASKALTGDVILEDLQLIAQICEQKQSPDMALRKLASKYLNSETKYVVKNLNVRSGYIAGYPMGSVLVIEFDVVPFDYDQVWDFMERQVNLSVPDQRLQTAVKVKNLVFDVLDGTLSVNDSEKNTKEFIRWAKEAIKA